MPRINGPNVGHIHTENESAGRDGHIKFDFDQHAAGGVGHIGHARLGLATAS